jgi:hypothetical protein
MKTFLSGSFGPWNDIQCGKWPASIVLEANGLGVQNPNDVAFLDTPQQPFDGPGGQCVAQSQQLAQSYKPPAGSHTCDPSHFVQSQASFKGTIANIRADPSILSAIKYCAVKEGVSESDIVALMVQESGGNRAARDGGTYGLMQLGPNDAKNDNPSLRGMSNEDIITLLKNEKKDPAWDKISVCTGAARIKRLQNQYNTDPRKAIAAYNTTGGLAPSPICIGKMVLECPIMSDADIKRCGDKLNWSGNRARTQTCFTSCEVTCARLDNFETIKGLWTGG